MKKSDLRQMIQEELSIADKDMEKAVGMRKNIEKILEDIEDIFLMAAGRLSNANSPGLQAAISAGIKAGLVSGKVKFKKARAKQELDKYFDR